MTESVGQFPNIEAAILEFADRHERKVLQRHANRANINGLENFLDVLKTITKLLYVYWRWGVVGKHQMIGRLTTHVDIFTGGSEGDRKKSDDYDDEKDGSFGYIAALCEMLQGNSSLLKKPFEENNVAGHLRVLLLIAQTVRVNPDEPGCSRPGLCLQTKLGQVRKSLGSIKMWPPTPDQVGKALGDYEMLTEDEIAAWLREV